MTAPPARRAGAPPAAYALSIIFGHHVGTLLAGAGTVGPTRWADWVDVLTPYAVLGTAGLALLAARATRRSWIVFALGAVTYAEGHGIHLAANSVGNAVPGPTAHLWDEVVGHWVWYVGWVLVTGALAAALARTPLPCPAALAYPLAALVGLTWATNTIEGGTPGLGLAAAAGFAGWGWVIRRGAGRLLLAAYGLAFVLLAGWGIAWGGFPQFSQLGWI